MNNPVRTPIVLLCFNRPAETAQVMATIRAARPGRLLVVADGPREGVPGEQERCNEVRRIVTAVDWPCEVLTNFADHNMGCRVRVSSGLNWAFEQNEALIVLEDDCVAHPDFFPYCDELLARYRDDDRIFAISGDNFQKGPPRTPSSYYFSQIFHCWGWASWRRSWQSVDLEMTDWPKLRDEGWLADTLADRSLEQYFTRAFDETYGGKNNSWAYRASYSSLAQGRINILPNVNLISNIGFGPDATHTGAQSAHLARDNAGLSFPLTHPRNVIVDRRADHATVTAGKLGLGRRVRNRLKSVLGL